MDASSKLRGAPLVVIELDTALAVTGWNERAEQLFVVAREAALGRSIAALLPVDGGEAGWRARLADHDGPSVWAIAALRFEAWTQPTRDADGQPDGWTVYGHDVTEREATKRRLALESMMLGAIKSNLDIVVWAIDRKGDYLYHQGKGIAAAGLKEGEFLGRNLFKMYPPAEHADMVRKPLAGEVFHAPPAESMGVVWECWYVPGDPSASEAAMVAVSLDVTASTRREAELRAKLEVIEQQQEVIRELSTPIIEVWDGVLTLPIVGLVDSARTAQVMDDLLQAVARTRARYAILDLTGVQVVDTGTASHLIGLIRAIGLLGAEGVLTGISPVIAQTVVSLGVDLSHVAVFAKLRDALKHCIARMSARR